MKKFASRHLFRYFGIFLVLLIQHQVQAQYCAPSYGSGCTYDDDINSFTLVGANSTSISHLNTGCDSLSAYVNLTSTIAPPTLIQGSSYSGTVSTNYISNEYVKIWIDFNNNNVFDTLTESVTPKLGPFGSSTPMNYTISVPINAPYGNHRMRVRLAYFVSGSLDPCDYYSYGETHDYLVHIDTLVPCTGTPAASTTVSSVASVCPNVNFNLSLGTTYTSMLAYQWQDSTVSGVWSNISGATSNTLTTTQSVPKWYRCRMTCSIGPSTTFSTPVGVALNPFSGCYCASSANSTFDDDIGRITIGTYSNPVTAPTPQSNNSAAVNTYTNFTTLTPANLLIGTNVPISVYQFNQGGFYDCWAKVFIDYNHDGMYDTATETIFSSASNSSNNYQPSGTKLIPVNAMPGISGMRVVLQEFGSSSSTLPCGTYGYGETEDYLVNLVSPPACSVLPPAVNTTINDSIFCSSETVALGLDTLILAASVTYEWQKSTTSATTGYSAIVGGTSPMFNTTQSVATWYRCKIKCTVSNDSLYSSVKKGIMDSFSNCYCPSAAMYTGDDDIGQLILGNFTNPSVAPSPQASNTTSIQTYTNFKSLPAIPVVKGVPTTVGIYQINSGSYQYNCWNKVFIDYNHDGQFDTLTETFYSGPTNLANNYFALGQGTIPTTAMMGVTGMRVVMNESGSANSTLPCGSYYYGETEDYNVDIQCQAAAFSLGNDTSVCNIASLPISGPITNGTTYLWSTGATTSSINATNSGTYSLSITDSAGCSNMDSVTIGFHTAPVVNLGADTTVCAQSYNLSASNGTTYAWSTGASISTITVTTAGTYYVLVTDSNGCSASDTVNIAMGTLPTVNSMTSQWGPSAYTAIFNSDAAGFTSITWNFGDGTTSNSISPSHTYTDGLLSHRVCVYVTSICGNDTLCLDVTDIKNIADNNKLNIYPNPAHDKIVIDLNSTDKINKVILVNQLGQEIEINQEVIGNKANIKLPLLSAGTYFIRVQANDKLYIKPISIK